MRLQARVDREVEGVDLVLDPGGERGIIASLARRIAERVVLCEAMMAAIAQADPDLVLSAVRCDSATVSVELIGDEDGRVAKRLPAWIKARSSE